MTMKRFINWKTVSTLAVLGTLSAACAERSPSSPRSGAVEPTTIRMAPPGAPSLGLASVETKKNNTSAEFTVTAAGGTFAVGNHLVVIPARGICDPATSSYGLGTWDAPCTPLETPLTIQAKVKTANGRTWVDFSPSIRFVPSSNPAKWAWVLLYNGSHGATNLSSFNVHFATGIDGAIVDETIDDPTLRTYVNTQTGFSLRRIKHFSGYTSSGFWSDCTPGVDEDCYENPPSGAAGPP